MIEAHEAMPTMTKRERHRLARFLSRAILNDPERIELMIDYLAATGAPPAELVDLAGADLDIPPAEVRRLADGFGDRP